MLETAASWVEKQKKQINTIFRSTNAKKVNFLLNFHINDFSAKFCIFER